MTATTFTATASTAANAIATAVSYAQTFYRNEITSGQLQADIQDSLKTWETWLDNWQTWSDELRADLAVVASWGFTLLVTVAALSGRLAGKAYRYSRQQAPAIAAAAQQLPEDLQPALETYRKAYRTVEFFVILFGTTAYYWTRYNVRKQLGDLKVQPVSIQDLLKVG